MKRPVEGGDASSSRETASRQDPASADPIEILRGAAQPTNRQGDENAARIPVRIAPPGFRGIVRDLAREFANRHDASKQPIAQGKAPKPDLKIRGSRR